MYSDRLWWRTRRSARGENCADNTTSYGNCCYCTDTTHCKTIAAIVLTERPRFRWTICFQPRHIKISISCRLICFSLRRNRALKRFQGEPPEDSKLKLVKKGREFQVGNQWLLKISCMRNHKKSIKLKKCSSRAICCASLKGCYKEEPFLSIHGTQSGSARNRKQVSSLDDTWRVTFDGRTKKTYRKRKQRSQSHAANNRTFSTDDAI